MVPQPLHELRGVVQRSRRELEAAGHKFRTKEEIDAEMEGMRNEWNDPLDDLESRHADGSTGDGSAKEKPEC